MRVKQNGKTFAVNRRRICLWQESVIGDQYKSYMYRYSLLIKLDETILFQIG